MTIVNECMLTVVCHFLCTDMMSRLQEALVTLQAEGGISPSDYVVSIIMCVLCGFYVFYIAICYIAPKTVISCSFFFLLQFYENLRTRYNVDLFKAFSSANGDLFTFQQQLASFKPPTSYHSTHQ